MVRNEKPFSREGGRELRLAGEGKDVRCGVDPGQEGKGLPEPGWKVCLWNYRRQRRDFQGVKGKDSTRDGSEGSEWG